MDDPLRATGRTTRIIDNLIQELFTTGKCTCIDHYDTPESSRFLAEKVVRRMTYEHSQKVIITYLNGYSYIELNKGEVR
jgi:hypothetical protein